MMLLLSALIAWIAHKAGRLPVMESFVLFCIVYGVLFVIVDIWKQGRPRQE